MKLTLFTALTLALVSSVLPGCDRGGIDKQSARPSGKDADAARGGSSGQSPAGAATGQASEGSTDDRKAPARPSSK